MGIDDDMPDALLEVYEMVKVTYVRGRRARGRRPAVEPRFPPPVWNAYEAVIHDEHRTNNMVEGYHNKFQKSIQAFHTRIWRYLEAIKKDQSDNEKLQAQLRAGHTKIRQPQTNRWVEVPCFLW